MFVSLSTYFYVGARMLNYSSKDVVYTNADLKRYYGANINHKKRSCFALFVHFVVKSAKNILTFKYNLSGAQTCPEATTHENSETRGVLKSHEPIRCAGFDATKSRSSMPKPYVFSILRSVAQPPRFTGRAVRDAAGEHRRRRAGGKWISFRLGTYEQHRK